MYHSPYTCFVRHLISRKTNLKGFNSSFNKFSNNKLQLASAPRQRSVKRDCILNKANLGQKEAEDRKKAQEEKKKAEEARKNELAELFKPVQTPQKVPFGTDPKTVL
jgi:hypothetical protein